MPLESHARTEFRNRSHEVSRLEAFSDIVFGFALTLLVVSLEVPKTYRELMADMRGFLGFAICFAILIWIWHAHYTFMRRYALHDAFTIVANCVLLFLVLFYVYPMKFLFNIVTGVSRAGDIGAGEARMLFTVYGLGLAGIFLTYVVMSNHAWRLREALQLNAVERHDTLQSMLYYSANAGVALLSVVMAWLLPERYVGTAGWIYFLAGPLSAWIGSGMGARRRDIDAAMTAQLSATAARSADPTPLRT